ncbi:hypothetical protein DV736_g4554, partial [Chaetothyriales sp. CBS 134916]
MIVAEDVFNKRAQDIRDGLKMSVLEILEERGYINQIVGSRDDLKTLIDNRRVGVYAGVDPTAPSLHVGHMVPFMALSWLFIHGYPVYFLLGGATAMIGDPTGRLKARTAQNHKQRKLNIAAMHMQLKRFGETMERYAARHGYQREWAWRRALENNSVWHGKRPIAEWMRLMLSGVRVGPMLGRDSVKNRLEKGDGMSLAEFCYPLVQAWDWWELFQKGVQVQIGGADQFGNILQGAEAVKYAASIDHPYQEKLKQEKIATDIKRQEEKKEKQEGSQSLWSETTTSAPTITEDPLGFTVPLLTTSSGEKFGKSTGNAIWLDPDLTPPFELYQFFLRSSDTDVEKYLKLLTFMPMNEIRALMDEHTKDASKRVAQHTLAHEFVDLIHGPQAADTAERQHRSVFNKSTTLGDIRASLCTSTNNASIERAPPHPAVNPTSPTQSVHAHSSNSCILPHSLVHGQHLSRILYSAGLVESRSEGGRLITKGGAYIGSTADGKKMRDSLSYIPADMQKARWEVLQGWLIGGEEGGDGEELLILRTGKWRVKIVRIIDDKEFTRKGLTAPGWDQIEGKPLEDDGKRSNEAREKYRARRRTEVRSGSQAL